MATTAEIARVIQPWVANWNALILITDKYTKFNAPQTRPRNQPKTPGSGNLSWWFTTYISPIYKQNGTTGSTINVTEITNRDQLLEQYKKLAAELPGIFNTIGVFPATGQLALTGLNKLMNDFTVFNENPPNSTLTPKPIDQRKASGFIKKRF